MRRFVFPVLLGLCLYFAVAEGEYSLLDVRRAEAELVTRQTALPAIREEIASLRLRIDALEHDDASLERLARERYGFIREGEHLYRLSGAATDATGGVDPRRADSPKDPRDRRGGTP